MKNGSEKLPLCQAQHRVNPSLDGLKIIRNLSGPVAGEGNSIEIDLVDMPTQEKQHVSLLGPPMLLTPISDMSKKMNEVSLKRQAHDPLSPGPLKKRRLFEEGSGMQPRTGPARTLGRKKSCRGVKKELRARTGGEAPQASQEQAGEINFPVEWLNTGQTSTINGETKETPEGLGGCPSTAPNEP